MGRMTLNAGVRWDRQANESLARLVPEHPFLPDWLPSVSFDGATHRSCGTTSRRASARTTSLRHRKTVRGRSPCTTGGARRTRRSARSIR